jgi:hypothetical protein
MKLSRAIRGARHLRPALLLAALCAGCRTVQHGQSSVEMLDPLAHAAGSTDKRAAVPGALSAELDPPEVLGELAKPVYPEAALAAHAGEFVLFATITIDTRGAVSDVTPSWDRLNIPSKYSDQFLGAVKAAVGSWKFVPAHVVHWERHPNGDDKYLYSETVPAQVDVKFTFEATGSVR